MSESMIEATLNKICVWHPNPYEGPYWHVF